MLEEIRARQAEERRQSREAAHAFATACASGDYETVYGAAEAVHETAFGWRQAMMLISRLDAVSDEAKKAFVDVWVEAKMLPLQVGSRPILAAALRVLMPRNHSGEAITVYRGTHADERRRRLYGFSWSTQIEVARGFACHWSGNGMDAVVLQTIAPPDAILLAREEEGFYDEGEIVVDPFRIGKVGVAERLPAAGIPLAERVAAMAANSLRTG